MSTSIQISSQSTVERELWEVGGKLTSRTASRLFSAATTGSTELGLTEAILAMRAERNSCCFVASCDCPKSANLLTSCMKEARRWDKFENLLLILRTLDC